LSFGESKKPFFSVIDPHSQKQRRKSSRLSARGDLGGASASEAGDTLEVQSQDEESESSEPKEERDDLINPFWIEDKALGRGEVDYLSGAEVQFWKDLIDKYLYPLDADSKKQVNIQSTMDLWFTAGLPDFS
jgi:chitin synthase